MLNLFVPWCLSSQAIATFLSPFLEEMDRFVLSLVCRDLSKHLPDSPLRKELKRVLRTKVEWLDIANQLKYPQWILTWGRINMNSSSYTDNSLKIFPILYPLCNITQVVYPFSLNYFGPDIEEESYAIPNIFRVHDKESRVDQIILTNCINPCNKEIKTDILFPITYDKHPFSASTLYITLSNNGNEIINSETIVVEQWILNSLDNRLIPLSQYILENEHADDSMVMEIPSSDINVRPNDSTIGLFIKHKYFISQLSPRKRSSSGLYFVYRINFKTNVGDRNLFTIPIIPSPKQESRSQYIEREINRKTHSNSSPTKRKFESETSVNYHDESDQHQSQPITISQKRAIKAFTAKKITGAEFWCIMRSNSAIQMCEVCPEELYHVGATNDKCEKCKRFICMKCNSGNLFGYRRYCKECY